MDFSGILAFIETERQKGTSYEGVVSLLAARGLTRPQIYRALEQVARQKHLNQVPKPENKSRFMGGVAAAILALIISPAVFTLYSQIQSQPIIESAGPVDPAEFSEPPVFQRKVLGASTSSASRFPDLAKIITPTLTASPSGLSTKKDKYTIAVYGDSMEDTMGEKLDYLQRALKDKYPRTSFALYNFGVGAENVETGLERFTRPFDYKSRRYVPLPEIHADIVILGSFAYNPLNPHDRNRHWLTLAQLIDAAKATGAKVYILAEIAPLKTGFGKGPNGPNWPEDQARAQSRPISANY